MSRIRVPIAGWLPGYKAAWLRKDLVAGATVWAILIPSAMAYASIVGVSPIVGLYTIPLALVAYAVFGGVRLLVVGPDAALSVLSAAVVASVVAGDNYLELTIALALITGAIFLLFSVLRLGWIADLIPDPVMKGFIEGLVWVTILDQVPKLLGVTLSGDADTFFPKLVETVRALPDTQPETAILGVLCLAALFGFKRFAPRWPAPLIVLAVAVAAVAVMNLESAGVAVVGETSGGLGNIGLPSGLAFSDLVALVPGALAIVVLGFTESLGASSLSTERTGDRVDVDQELFALGMANIGSGLSGGYVVTGSLSKTAVAIDARGKTQVGFLFTAVLAVLTVIFLLPLFAFIAQAVLAAIIIVAMAGLSDLGYFRALYGVRNMELATAVTALAGVLIIGVLGGVIVGVALALLIVTRHIGRPPAAVAGRTEAGTIVDIAFHPDAAEIPGMVIWRPYGAIFFMNARWLSDRLQELVDERSNIRVVVADLSAMSEFDSTGAKFFSKMRHDLDARGIEVWVVGMRANDWQQVTAHLEGEDESPPRFFVTNDEAIDAFEASPRED